MKNITQGRIFVAGLAVLTLSLGGWAAISFTTFEFQPQTSISIKGTSTMHDFECKAGVVNGTLELPGTAPADVAQAFASLKSVNVSVPVAKIDCGNGTMDKKMRSALEVSKAPLITYTMSKIAISGAANGEGYYPLTASGRLAIAGSERPIQMTVLGKQLNDGKFQFTGSTKIRMSEWGISPPTAMLGTMKTGDEVTVSFQVLAAN